MHDEALCALLLLSYEHRQGLLEHYRRIIMWMLFVGTCTEYVFAHILTGILLSRRYYLLRDGEQRDGNLTRAQVAKYVVIY